MGKFNLLSYLFLFIAIATQLLDYILAPSLFYYNNYVQFTLFIIGVSPIIGMILGLFGKKGDYKKFAIGLNIVFFVVFSLLALLNFWIITFGK